MSYLRLYRGSAREVALAVVSGIAQSIVLVPIIWLVRYAFDTLIPGSDLEGLLIVGGADGRALPGQWGADAMEPSDGAGEHAQHGRAAAP